MKRYRFPLIIALLFVLWLFFGRDLITRVLNPTDETIAINGVPDGLSGRLLYTQGRGGIWQIDLASGESAVWWQLPGVGYVSGITPSPDATSFVVAYEPQMPDNSPTSSTDLYLLDANTLQATPIIERTTITEVYDHPLWSGDGAWLYYAHYALQLNAEGAVQGSTQTLERLPADNFESTPEIVLNDALEFWLTEDMVKATYVYFDPQSFLYSLWIADIDGADAVELVADNIFQGLGSPRISPDGRAIYFGASGAPIAQTASDLPGAQAHGAPWDIWKIDLADGAYSRVTNLGIDGPALAWSPEGRYLAFVALEGVYMLDMATNDLYRLADSTAEGEILWLDN
ncbi:MAG: hypothetical protein RLP44_30875 [Aggregatilineales bacterium]